MKGIGGFKDCYWDDNLGIFCIKKNFGLHFLGKLILSGIFFWFFLYV